jgi:Tol biopolymer transport system component
VRARTAAAVAGLTLAAAAGVVFGIWWERSREPAILQTSAVRYLTYSNRDYSPAASPSGRLIAFSSDRDGQRRIWLKEIATGGEVPLTTGGPDDFPRFSSDGSEVLFTRHNSLYRISTVGGEVRKLVDDVVSGDWSPEGTRIAFLRWSLKDGVTSTTVGTVSGSGEDAREIARVANHTLDFPRWSPDGPAGWPEVYQLQ